MVKLPKRLQSSIEIEIKPIRNEKWYQLTIKLKRENYSPIHSILMNRKELERLKIHLTNFLRYSEDLRE